MSKKYKLNPKRTFITELIIVMLLALAQVVLLILYTWRLFRAVAIIEIASRILSIFVVIYVINKRENNSYKLAWVVPILLFPAFGGILYVFCQGRIGIFAFRKKILDTEKQFYESVKDIPDASEKFESENPSYKPRTEYLKGAGFPMYSGTDAKYYSIGDDAYDDIISALKDAKEYIFLEYFIIHEGFFWNSILDILTEKAAEGVDVRIIYDGMGSVTTLPRKYSKTLNALGIKCKVFNRFVPVISTMQNNRDHRKILTVDGKVAFTGGVNLADEYINRIEKFGKWKDSAIRVTGDAAQGFTLIFLRNWNIINKERDDPSKYVRDVTGGQSTGYFQPYCDNPFDSDEVGRNVYLDMISRAKKSVYIMTPYLIMDEELDCAVKLAARSGIDVRIITPHKADKKFVFMVTRSSYAELMESGVKIYEYTPGFIHSKNLLVDGECAVVGSVNFDYRSLYLHFECAQLFYSHKALEELNEDFEKTFEQSQKITFDDCRKNSGISRIATQILKIFSPLF